MAASQLRDMIIVLPGISGSNLALHGEDVWGTTLASGWRALRTAGRSISRLQMSDQDRVCDLERAGEISGLTPDEASLGDGVTPTGLAQRVVVPGLIRIDGYTRIRELIGRRLKIRQGYPGVDGPAANYFEFAYDWRRDNRVTARLLKGLIDRELPKWRSYAHYPEARVILIAHSMGGLVSRWYLQQLGGWERCRELITFGTPFGGSLGALDSLANGYKHIEVLGKTVLDLTAMLESFPSVYQLLPRYPVVSQTAGADARYVHEVARGIRGLDADRVHEAYEGFHCVMDDAINKERSCDIRPLIGRGHTTLQSASLDANAHLVLSPALSIEKPKQAVMSINLPTMSDAGKRIDDLFAGGDGTVPHAAAFPSELANSGDRGYSNHRHSQLQAAEDLVDRQILRIAELQVGNATAIRGTGDLEGDDPMWDLELTDVLRRGEVELRARLLKSAEPDRVSVRVKDLERPDERVMEHELAPDRDGYQLRLDDLPAGEYRIELRASPIAGLPAPIREIFEVIEE